MIKVLCYGDSNVYGFNPETGARYDKNERWSGILSEYLGKNFDVYEQGMNNRTGFFKNAQGLIYSGSEYLVEYLKNNKPADICILALGTNDLQIFYDLDENSLKRGLTGLIQTIKKSNLQTKIIIVPPVKINTNFLKSGFSTMFDLNSIKKNNELFYLYRVVAEQNGCYYFDFNEYVSPSEFDGIHYTIKSHQKIAKYLSEFIKTI